MTQEFVTLSRDVVEQALEAFEQIDSTYWHDFVTHHVETLRSALDQPPTTEQSSAVQQPQVEQEPVAWVWFDANERPCSVTLHGPTNTTKEWGHAPLYTHQQNLRCKSNQARLATLWGYVKADQPQGELAQVIGRAVTDGKNPKAIADEIKERLGRV